MSPENVITINKYNTATTYPTLPMKSELVEKASLVIIDPQVLVNIVSKRVRQLNSGRSPLIPTLPSMGAADIALTEIIEGKIKVAEIAEI
jgi:DNA-directed RNA polymerase subunit omega